jgi:hypothetical protein
MKKAAFLSMDSLIGFECYDHLLFEPLRKLGWLAEEISWRKETDWNQFEAVIVRSTWDYQNNPAEFFSALENINRSTAHLENPLDMMKWNLNKNYLNDLREKDIIIVETIFENDFFEEKIPDYFDFFNTDEIIIKPCISANADNTYRIKTEEIKNRKLKFNNSFAGKDFMVQPFMKSIIDEGEYSLFYFGCEYSHTILKKPKAEDFRVQEEHGGKLFLIDPLPGHQNISKNILNKLDEIPLYARIDLIRDHNNNFALMELELIEPSLYFNMDKNSPQRFAEVFADWMNK